MVKISGFLTSRIETRTKDHETYYYGFFKLERQEQEIPVIFKGDKPSIIKGSEVSLAGTWANSQKDRPSFTCHQYQLLKEPDPPTLASLQKELSFLLRPSLEKKKDWTETTDFLFKKQKELSEIKELSQLGECYLQAYFLTKQAFYANYQAEHLEQANFNLETYLQRMASELEVTKRQMINSGWKEVKHE